MDEKPEFEVFELKDAKTVPDIIHPYTSDLKNGHVPIVIDNGSYNCRVGWATHSKPCLVFKNLVAKTRKERGKKDGELQVGNDITNLEAVRFQLKTQFDRNVAIHMEVQEQIFDHVFFHLGIDSEGSVNHPIVLSEAFLNPNFSRQSMSELLFECYGVPGISYGVDALFSYHCKEEGNLQRSQSGIIINLGYHTIHIIPIIDGVVDVAHARRINIGGFDVTSYMHRLLQLKYPVHCNAITLSRAEELVHNHSFLPEEYGLVLNEWSDQDYYDKHVLRIQLPYVAPPAVSSLTADQQKERRKELAKRLVEINARKRDERLAEDEDMLNQLLDVQNLIHSGQEKAFQVKALSSFDMGSEAELVKQIGNLQARIQRTKQKIAAVNSNEDVVSEEPKPKIPKQTALRLRDGEDAGSWLARLRKERADLVEKKAARQQKRQDMSKRRTAAAQERMRIISELAKRDKKEDNFGMRDEDWDVYKAIRRDGGDSDSEEEQERLVEIEEVLRQHDRTFVEGGELISTNPGEAHQLHVGIEKIRAVEILFQPGMVGIEEAGLAETLGYVLKHYSPENQNKLVSNIFLTGGCATIPGLKERLIREVREIRPFQSVFCVNLSRNPILSAWNGAREFANMPNFSKEFMISKDDFTEKGAEYLKEHKASNVFNASPAPLCQPQTGSTEDVEMEIF
ncbi:Actin-related protein 5 [Frankliniella fusca]|uniref:Actin-related protein 5 n=1 Tax=Frankliniella fusca TaxID=407009 RepID=A0AAE1LAF5_9NEOP|nr:Actin-related protein 5 [Frankliniella fusca]